MNMTIKMIVAVVGMAAALGASAFSKSIGYSGVVRRADGKPFERAQNVPMTFRIYDSFDPDTAVWARTIPVRVETDGRFDVELSDLVGSQTPLPKGREVISLERACANVRGSVVIGQTMAGDNEEFRETLTVYPLVERAAFARTTPTAVLKDLRCDTVVVQGNMRADGDLSVPRSTQFTKPLTLDVGNRIVEVGRQDQPLTLYGGLMGWTYRSDTNPDAWNDRARLAFLNRDKTVKYYYETDKYTTQRTSIPFNVFAKPPTNGTANVNVPAGTTITGIQYF